MTRAPVRAHAPRCQRRRPRSSRDPTRRRQFRHGRAKRPGSRSSSRAIASPGASSKKACRGASAVVSTTSSTVSRQEGDSIENVDRQGTIESHRGCRGSWYQALHSDFISKRRHRLSASGRETCCRGSPAAGPDDVHDPSTYIFHGGVTGHRPSHSKADAHRYRLGGDRLVGVADRIARTLPHPCCG